MFYEDVIVAGFGGQGVLMLGKLIAEAALREGLNVTWIPAYGPEMRGGTANCTVVISDVEVGSPVVTSPKAAIVMNQPSADTFGPRVKKGGYLFVNSSLVPRKFKREDIEIIEIPASDIALEIGSERVANIVMLGAYIEVTKVVRDEVAEKVVFEVLGKKKSEFVEMNRRAYLEGKKYVQSRGDDKK